MSKSLSGDSVSVYVSFVSDIGGDHYFKYLKTNMEILVSIVL